MLFQDLFSGLAKEYSQFRPRYPVKLFQYLATLTRDHNRAWDVGTGNGQAAVDLAQHYEEVIATDPSRAQIDKAIPRDRVSYFVGSELQSRLEETSVDLVTVAQALHWFDREIFYKEVLRVLKPSGICAAWAYDFNEPIQPDIDEALKEFYFTTLGPYWAPNNKLIWEGYRTMDFPFEKIDAPSFLLESKMSLAEFIGFLSSWSATAQYIEKTKVNPLSAFFEKIQPMWGDPQAVKPLSWKIHLLVGRTPDAL